MGIRLKNHDYLNIADKSKTLEEFVKNATNLITRYNMDGLDLRWNYAEEESVQISNVISFVLLA